MFNSTCFILNAGIKEAMPSLLCIEGFHATTYLTLMDGENMKFISLSWIFLPPFERKLFDVQRTLIN